ncbi:hypothetical protein NA57DRAFT_37113, partial [Rhizodiscina lignyota]
EISICYARRRLRPGGPVDLALQEIQPSDMRTAGTTTANGQIFPHAILGLATIFFGTQHRQGHISDHGYAIHGVALKQLNQALSDPKYCNSDEVMLSVVTLAMLESLVPSGSKNYLKHMIGLERLLGLRDPSSYCAPKTAELYKNMRPMILLASLRTRRPSILATTEWKRVLRANCSDEEMQEQDLFDVLADCTVLIAEGDSLFANCDLNFEGAKHQQDELKQRALNLLTYLGHWKRRWGGDKINAYSETSAVSKGYASPPFLTMYEFRNESTAIMLMLYNTTLIYVLKILASFPSEAPRFRSSQRRMQNVLQDAGYLDDPWKHTKDEYVAAERLAALEVCRCLPDYLIRKSRLNSEYSPPVVHWAVTTAWMTLLGNESAEGRWMTNLLNMKSKELIAKGTWEA